MSSNTVLSFNKRSPRYNPHGWLAVKNKWSIFNRCIFCALAVLNVVVFFSSSIYIEFVNFKFWCWSNLFEKWLFSCKTKQAEDHNMQWPFVHHWLKSKSTSNLKRHHSCHWNTKKQCLIQLLISHVHHCCKFQRVFCPIHHWDRLLLEFAKCKIEIANQNNEKRRNLLSKVLPLKCSISAFPETFCHMTTFYF